MDDGGGDGGGLGFGGGIGGEGATATGGGEEGDLRCSLDACLVGVVQLGTRPAPVNSLSASP